MSSRRSWAVKPGVVQALRARKGWSQLDLATKADISPRTVSSLEAATGEFLIHTIKSVADALKVECNELIVDVNQPDNAQQIRSALTPVPKKGNVHLMLVFDQDRVEIDETLPMSTLLGKIFQYIIDGKMVPVGIKQGSTVLTMESSVEVAVKVMRQFFAGRFADDGLVAIQIPRNFAFLVPAMSKSAVLSQSVGAVLSLNTIPILGSISALLGAWLLTKNFDFPCTYELDGSITLLQTRAAGAGLSNR